MKPKAITTQSRRPSEFTSLVYYALTIKKTGRVFPYKYQYENILDYLRAKGFTIEDGHYEIDTEHRLHWHGTFRCLKNLYLKNIVTVKGWHIHPKLIPSHDDLIIWSNYVSKYYTTDGAEDRMCALSDQRVSSKEIYTSDYPFIPNAEYENHGWYSVRLRETL